MSAPGPGLQPQAIAWALLSQVFWVPLIAIDAHDRWKTEVRQITPPNRQLPEAAVARSRPFSLDDLLGATRPVQELASRAISGTGALTREALRHTGTALSSAGTVLSSAGSGAASLLDAPLLRSIDQPAPAAAARSSVSERGLPAGHPAHSLLGRALTRAELLGGSLGLADLQEPSLSPLALVERAVQRSSGDPMAALPAAWRDPMRQALLRLPGAPQRIGPARVVHVPSSRIDQPATIPLALQSDGSVDVLQAPRQAAVLGEIEAWSRQQQRPAAGALTPAVVHLHPLPSEATTAAVSSAPRPAAALRLDPPPAAAPAPAAAAEVSTSPSSSPSSVAAPIQEAAALTAPPAPEGAASPALASELPAEPAPAPAP